MPQVVRVGDNQQDYYGVTSLLQGSSNVFANGIAVGRVGDRFGTHEYGDDYISQGSSTVFANGISVGRVGDPTAPHGGTIISGSSNVFAN
jgi:Uncharacterized conserved protein